MVYNVREKYYCICICFIIITVSVVYIYIYGIHVTEIDLYILLYNYGKVWLYKYIVTTVANGNVSY